MAMTLNGHRASTAGGKAYALIRGAIIAGDFGPGRRLKEDELTTLCDVSRTPVREALRRLALEGLVVVTPNAGAQVSTISRDELEEIYALRAMVESRAAERAARFIDDAAIARLRTLSTQIEQSVAEGGSGASGAFTAANSEFHHIILDAARSPRLSAMAALVVEAPLTVRTFSRYTTQDLNRSRDHHRELIDALEARDGAWAAAVMKSHVLAAYRALAREEPPRLDAAPDRDPPARLLERAVA